jgi:hypothetical protein
LQILPYDDLNLYTAFPEDGYIVLLTTVGVADFATGADLAEQMRLISGKEQATFIGYAIGGEVWLLE